MKAMRNRGLRLEPTASYKNKDEVPLWSFGLRTPGSAEA